MCHDDNNDNNVWCVEYVVIPAGYPNNGLHHYLHDDNDNYNDNDDNFYCLDVAISAGYPNNGLYKLYIRKCKCELELGRYRRSI